MNKDLSRIVAELFAKPAEEKELPSRVKRLGAEIRGVVQSEDTVLGKFRGLLESLKEVVPDERQRYHAALKALTSTSRLGRKEILKAMSGQLDELKIIEKSLTSALPGWRDELKAMRTRAQETKDEIAKLRGIISRLEGEEKEILAGVAAREKEMEFAEKTFKELFADIGAEMAAFKKKVEDFTVEGPAVQPVPQKSSGQSEVPAGQQGVPPPQNSKWQKKCPNCGGQMNFHAPDHLWICYSCAYQEAGESGLSVAGGEENGSTDAPRSTPVPGPAPSSLPIVPLAAMTTGEYEEPKKHLGKPTKKKSCPVCHKKMYWYPDIGSWLCPHCEYQRRG